MSQEEKPKNENDNVVIAFFADQAAAESAIEGIKNWDRINDHFELGAIGTIFKEGDKIKTKVGRKTGKGAKVGAVVGVIAAVLTGGASLIVTAVGAGAVGGALGHFFKKSTGLTKEEIADIGQQLDAGRVAVVVQCDDFEIPMVTEYMEGSKGTVRTYKVTDEALIQAASTPEVMDAVAEGAA
jgi:outer membrane lipoprotein SlyB